MWGCGYWSGMRDVGMPTDAGSGQLLERMRGCRCVAAEAATGVDVVLAQKQVLERKVGMLHIKPTCLPPPIHCP